MRNVDKKLFRACKEGSLIKVQNLLTKKIFRAFPNCNAISEMKAYYHETPLMATNNLEIIKLLVKNGAEINKKITYFDGGKEFDDNALYTHCWRKNILIVEYLIANGADVNVNITRFDKKHNSILSQFVADDNADDKNLQIVKMLINHGANVNSKNDFGLTPLDLVQKHGIHQFREVTEQIRLFLIENGAECSSESKVKYDISVLNDKLIEACEKNKIDVLQELITNGADINAQPFGITPLIAAIKNGYLEIVKFLIENGADVNQKDFRHDSPLNYSITWDRPDIACLLIESGALIEDDYNLHQLIMEREIHFSSFVNQIKCPYCNQPNSISKWPINGDSTSFYFQKDEGKYSLPITCPHCKKAWYIVWDNNPGIIKNLFK